jgi:hypothetical protein
MGEVRHRISPVGSFTSSFPLSFHHLPKDPYLSRLNPGLSGSIPRDPKLKPPSRRDNYPALLKNVDFTGTDEHIINLMFK